MTVESPGEPTTFTVAAQIGSLPPIVTTVVPLAKGAIIRDGDVRLVAATTDDLTTDAAHSIEEVVGKETKLAIAPGMPIPEQAVRRQILVHRGDLIMVCARTAGIRIHVDARAKEDGGLGDLISVESIPERRIYTARVSGEQEAEVYARAVKAEGGGRQ